MTHNLPWTEQYPWISFDFNPSAMNGPLWAILGECSSKIDHVSGTPLRGDLAEEMRTVYVAKGVHATTAIEGNTLSEAQVRRRMEGQLDLPESQQYLQQEVDNILEACNLIMERLHQDKMRPFKLTPADLREFNRIVLKNLDHLEEGVEPGEYRKYVVGVHDYRAPDPQYLDEMVQRMCEWLNQGQFKAEFGPRFVSAILRAIVAHLYIAWVHPFGDGNGRSARIVEFDIMIRAGVPMVCAHLLSDHYNRTRAAYYRALSGARKHPIYFVEYAAIGLRDALVEQISTIRRQQINVTWVNYVMSLFHKDDDKSAQARRRRELALELEKYPEPTPVDKLTTLTPKLAGMYTGKTTRTLQRDLAALRAKKLILFDKTGVSANIDMIRAFLPYAGPGIRDAS